MLCLSDGVLCLASSGGQAQTPAPQEKSQGKVRRLVSDTPPAYTAQEIARAAEGDGKLRMILELTQQSLGKLLSFAETQKLFSFYDWLGLPPDVVVMLVEYCSVHGHKNMRYIEKVAVDWAEKGIDSMEKAEEYIQRFEQRDAAETKIRSLMGIGSRALTAREKEYICHWVDELKYGLDMIRLAYERGVNAIGKASFSYINSILESWKAKGYKTPADAMEEKKGRTKAAKAEGGLDLDAYEKWSWNKLHEEE